MFGRRKLDNAVGLCNLLGILPFGNEANKLAIIWEYEGTCTKAPPRHVFSQKRFWLVLGFNHYVILLYVGPVVIK